MTTSYTTAADANSLVVPEWHAERQAVYEAYVQAARSFTASELDVTEADLAKAIQYKLITERELLATNYGATVYTQVSTQVIDGVDAPDAGDYAALAAADAVMLSNTTTMRTTIGTNKTTALERVIAENDVLATATGTTTVSSSDSSLGQTLKAYLAAKVAEVSTLPQQQEIYAKRIARLDPAVICGAVDMQSITTAVIQSSKNAVNATSLTSAEDAFRALTVPADATAIENQRATYNTLQQARYYATTKPFTATPLSGNAFLQMVDDDTFTTEELSTAGLSAGTYTQVQSIENWSADLWQTTVESVCLKKGIKNYENYREDADESSLTKIADIYPTNAFTAANSLEAIMKYAAEKTEDKEECTGQMKTWEKSCHAAQSRTMQNPGDGNWASVSNLTPADISTYVNTIQSSSTQTQWDKLRTEIAACGLGGSRFGAEITPNLTVASDDADQAIEILTLLAANKAELETAINADTAEGATSTTATATYLRFLADDTHMMSDTFCSAVALSNRWYKYDAHSSTVTVLAVLTGLFGALALGLGVAQCRRRNRKNNRKNNKSSSISA